MFKVNNKDIVNNVRRRSGVFIVNFEHISHLALVFVLLPLSKKMPAGISSLPACSIPPSHIQQTLKG